MMKKSNATEAQYTFLSVIVESYSVQSEATLNINLSMDRPILYDLDDQAYEFISTLTVYGQCTYPKDRAGDAYEITFRGGELHSGDHSLRLKDFQAKNEYGSPVYKTYRGESIPVFVPPQGLAVLNKRRGEPLWNSWLHIRSGLLQDMLVTLAHIKPVYLAIHEKKIKRVRWIQSVSLQTTNPEDE